jgi:hypothetical protein
LTEEIAEHDEDVTVWTGDQKAATTVREVEKAGCDARRQDYSEPVSRAAPESLVRVSPWGS